MIRKTGFWIAALAVIVAIVAIWYYHRNEMPVPKTVLKVTTVPVEVASATPMVVPAHVNTIGTLYAKQKADISFEIGGKVVKILFTPGAYVKSGTALIQLDDQIYRSNLTSAIAALSLSKAKYLRMKRLINTGAVAKQDLDEGWAQFLEDKAKVVSNQAYLAETLIKAPFSGFIGAKQVSLGDYVASGQLVTTLVDRLHLEARYKLSEKYLHDLKLGQAVIVKADDGKTKPVDGKVTFISPSVDVATHSVAVHADVDNKNNTLTPGLFVTVQQTLGKVLHALVVPEAAVVPTITGAMVYVIKNSRAKAVNVKTGPTFGDKAAILQGLQSGDRVVIAGQDQLRDGALVREVKTL